MDGIHMRPPLDLSEIKMIPLNWCPTKHYTISISGFDKFTVQKNDIEFSKILIFASETVKSFINVYKDTHAFSEPVFGYNLNDRLISIKIGTMENEIFDQLLKKSKE